MKNDETHSKALELEHVTFENERLQAELAKMKKVNAHFLNSLWIEYFIVSIAITYWSVLDT